MYALRRVRTGYVLCIFGHKCRPVLACTITVSGVFRALSSRPPSARPPTTVPYHAPDAAGRDFQRQPTTYTRLRRRSGSLHAAHGSPTAMMQGAPRRRGAAEVRLRAPGRARVHSGPRHEVPRGAGGGGTRTRAAVGLVALAARRASLVRSETCVLAEYTCRARR